MDNFRTISIANNYLISLNGIASIIVSDHGNFLDCHVQNTIDHDSIIKGFNYIFNQIEIGKIPNKLVKCSDKSITYALSQNEFIVKDEFIKQGIQILPVKEGKRL